MFTLRYSILFIFLISLNSIGENKTSPHQISSKDKNYKFTMAENSPYKKMLFHKFVNEEADFVLVNSKDNIHFALIAEKIGKDLELSQEEFLDEVKDDFTFLEPGVKVVKEVPSDVDRITGHRIQLTKKNAGANYIYDVRAINHNGIYYQLITYCWEKNGFKKLKEEADYLAQKFKILDKDNEYFSDNVVVLENYSSPLSPLELKFTDKKYWFEWEDFEYDCPESEYAGHTANKNQRFCITTILYDSKKHNDEVIVNTFLRDFNMKLSDDHFSIVKKIDSKPYRSWKLKTSRDSDGDQYDYYFDIYFTPKAATLICMWGESGSLNIKQAHQSLLKAVTFKKNNFKAVKLSPEQKTSQRILSNSLGLVYYRQEKFPKAADCFLNAFNYDKNYTKAATNYFWSISRNSKIKEILEFIEKEPHILKDPEALAWQAFGLKDTKRFKEAIKAYEKLFNIKNFESETDFVDFASLLLNEEMDKRLDVEINKYLAKEKPQTTYHNLSKLLLDYEALETATRVLEKLPKKFKETIESKRHYLKFHISHGDYKKADALFEKLLKDGHRDRQTLYTGAKLYYDIGWYHKSKTVLTELLKASPNDKDAKGLLDSTLGYLGEGNKGNTTQPIKPVKLPSKLKDLNSKVKITEKETDVHYEHLITSYSFKDGKLKKTIYKKIILKTSTGVKNNSTFYFKYNPTSSSIYVNTLKVTDPKSKKSVHSDRNAFYLKDTDDDLATEDKTLCMPVSSLQPGCIVEYVITQEFGAKYDDFPYKRQWLCMTVPYELLAVSVSGDIDKVSYKLKNSKLKVINENNELIFNTVEKPVYKSEDNDAPAEYNYPLLILGSKTLTWEKEVKDYRKKIKSKLVPSDKLKELVGSLTKDAKSNEDKVQALISYIQKNITYQGIEFGSRGIIPDTPLKVINQKYGDCKDMAVLLHQMLKVLNIKSTLTLVSTDDIINEEIPSLDQFNHMILYIDSLDKFVDCTVKHANLLTIGNTYMHGNKALLINDKSSFKTIPYFEVKGKSIQVNSKLSLLENDLIQVKENVTLKGYYAYFLRNNLIGTDQKDRSDKIKDWINYYPEMNDFTAEIINLDDYMKNLEFKLSYKIKRAIKKLGKEKVFNLEAPWLHFYINPDKVENRKNSILFYYDFSFASHVELDTKGFADIKVNIPNFKKTSKFFEGSINTIVSKNTMLIKSECSRTKGVYPAQDYASYYETAKSFIDKAVMHIKLVPVTK